MPAMVFTGVKIMKGEGDVAGGSVASAYSVADAIKIAGPTIEAIFQQNTHTIDNIMAGEDFLHFENAAVFPGLINSHDHLDFNLYPSMGNYIYSNYRAWGQDIHRRQASEIASIRAINKDLRVLWGIYKNVLAGVTTVVQHGENFPGQPELLHVFDGCKSLHSVGLEKFWRLKLNRPFRNKLPFVIHIGEGTCGASKREINALLRWNIFKRRLVGVHGIAMDAGQARFFQALVWCPDANFFLYDRTAAVDQLKNSTRILFGTDSTLSAHWDVWKQLRRARETGLLDDERLFAAVNSAAADSWGLDHTGRIAPGKDADLFVVQSSEGATPYNDFFATSLERILLVMHRGKITLFDPSLLPQLRKLKIGDYSAIYVNGHPKFILGRMDELLQTFINAGIDINLPVKLTP